MKLEWDETSMKTVRMTIDVLNPESKPIGRFDARRVDATTEADIASHKAADDADAMLDAAKFARRVRWSKSDP